MTIKAVLLASTVGCAVLASQAAYADVKFVRVQAGATAYTAAWNGISDNQRTSTKSETAKAKTLAKAEEGIGALPNASSSSGGDKRNASAADSEAATVELASQYNADLSFGGAAYASVTSGAGSDAYAEGGGSNSDAFYEFRTTSPERLTVDYATEADLDADDSYELVVYKGKKEKVVGDLYIGSNASDSFFLDLAKGLYTVAIYVLQPDAISVGPGEDASASYYGDFQVTLSAVPEASTWVMIGAGFGALGALSAVRRRKVAALA